MSGTIASRNQTRFGYGPGLRVGTYPGQQPGAAPQMGAQAPAQPAAPYAARAPQNAPMATPAPAAAPVYAGSIGMGQAEGSNGGGSESNIGSNADGNVFGLGPNPGNLGSGLSGFGVPGEWGQIGSALGGLAGLAFGVPGLGLAAGALGTFADTRGLNGTLTDMGMAPEVDFGQGMLSNSTFGLAGQSPVSQFNDIATRGQDYGAVSDFFGFNDLPATPTAPAAPADGGSGVGGLGDVAGVGTGYGDGFGDYGNMGDYGNTPGYSGDYGAPSGDYGAPSGDPGGYGDPGDAGGDAGYMDGGYTGKGGDGIAQPHKPAGTVHEHEVVIPAAMVDRYGLEVLMALAGGRIAPSRLQKLAAT